MPEEAQAEIGTSAEASKAAINSGAKIADTARQRIAQVLFDITMAPLLGIQVWGIGRKPVHLDLRMCAEIFLDHRRAMGIEPIPDNDQPAGDIALKMAEGEHNIGPTDRMRKVALIDMTGEG